jgi:glycosyltransferase involved in cell wall biosynthesis
MKVLHVIPFPGIGGTEVATRRIADAVRPLGVQSAALLLSPTDDQVAYFEQAGVPCFADRRRPEPSLVREAPRFLLDSWKIARLCATFDLVHCADVLAAYYMAVAARLARRPTICHVRNRVIRLPRRDGVFVGAANHFAFVSADTRRRFPMRLPDRRASILYDGVDIPPRTRPAERAAAACAVRAEFRFPADTVIAAMFARVNPQKDYDTLIRAAAILRETHPQLRFLVIGDNAGVPLNRQHFEHVQAVAGEAGVLDRFVFTGFREDTHRLMLAADICVLCTHFEGLPLVLIEAMAAGRPCIATAVDGIPETLTDGVTGLLHAHEDAQALAAAIARFADAPDAAEEIGTNARAEAERRFSQDRFARDVHALYARFGRPSSAGAVRQAGGEGAVA